MRSQTIFSEYIWLVGLIHRAGRITLREINDKWQRTTMSEGKPMARSTFNRHKESIEEIFGVSIECDASDGFKYYIANTNDINEGSVKDWMISTLSLNNMIRESVAIQSRILTENYAPSTHLNTIIEAMKANKKLSVTYKKYGDDEGKTKILDPYCMKLYHQRWYLLGHSKDDKDPKKDNYVTYSLDRIVNIDILDEEFKIGKFNAKRYYEDCFGIFNSEKMQAQKILIKAFGKREVNTLKDLPLHHSQKEVESADDYSIFEYYLKPSLDFQGQILSRGAFLQVLEPETLKNAIKETLQKALDNYENK